MCEVFPTLFYGIVDREDDDLSWGFGLVQCDYGDSRSHVVKTMSWLPPILLGMVSLYHL